MRALEPFRAVIEATGTYRWLYDLLASPGTGPFSGSLRSPGAPGCRAQTPVWSESPPVGYNAEMKLQFSLATLLVCMTVLAVVLSYSISKPVIEPLDYSNALGPFWSDHDIARNPTLREVSFRFLCFGPPALIGTLAALWAIRRLKSRRHTEPPVG
jgi:hypothetical protein